DVTLAGVQGHGGAGLRVSPDADDALPEDHSLGIEVERKHWQVLRLDSYQRPLERTLIVRFDRLLQPVEQPFELRVLVAAMVGTGPPVGVSRAAGRVQARRQVLERQRSSRGAKPRKDRVETVVPRLRGGANMLVHSEAKVAPVRGDDRQFLFRLSASGRL